MSRTTGVNDRPLTRTSASPPLTGQLYPGTVAGTFPQVKHGLAGVEVGEPVNEDECYAADEGRQDPDATVRGSALFGATEDDVDRDEP